MSCIKCSAPVRRPPEALPPLRHSSTKRVGARSVANFGGFRQRVQRPCRLGRRTALQAWATAKGFGETKTKSKSKEGKGSKSGTKEESSSSDAVEEDKKYQVPCASREQVRF